jgi:hypothetical protein
VFTFDLVTLLFLACRSYSVCFVWTPTCWEIEFRAFIIIIIIIIIIIMNYTVTAVRLVFKDYRSMNKHFLLIRPIHKLAKSFY